MKTTSIFPTPSKIGHIFFDFDSTLTVAYQIPRLGQHALSDNTSLCLAMNDAEITENFGGQARLQVLAEFFGELRRRGVQIFVLSYGRKEAIVHLLQNAGLAKFVRKVFGSDGTELQSVGQVKWKIIERYMQHERMSCGAKVLFVDDAQKHLDGASCLTHLVANRQSGLTVYVLSVLYSVRVGFLRLPVTHYYLFPSTEMQSIMQGCQACQGVEGASEGEQGGAGGKQGGQEGGGGGQVGDVRFADDGGKPIAHVVLIERTNHGRPTARPPQDTSKWEVKAAEAGGMLYQQGAPPVKAAVASPLSPELKVVRSTDAARHTVGAAYCRGGVVYAQDRSNR
jgi:hypothetical protein